MSEYSYKHHRERMRQKYLASGLNGFSDRDKLEFLLFYAIPVKDTKPIAHDLLEKFKTLGGVFDASIDELVKVKGVGTNTAILIKFIPELVKDYAVSSNINEALDTSEAVCNFFKKLYVNELNEVLKVACLDDRLRLVCCENLMEGNPGSVRVDIRKLVSFTYAHNSENIIIAHNHPNGEPIPSDDDIRMTAELYKILKPLGIVLLDHIIVAKGRALSLKECGALSMQGYKEFL